MVVQLLINEIIVLRVKNMHDEGKFRKCNIGTIYKFDDL